MSADGDRRALAKLLAQAADLLEAEAENYADSDPDGLPEYQPHALRLHAVAQLLRDAREEWKP